jgi:hypothetical protein
LRAFPRIAERDRAADAGGATGDHRNPFFEEPCHLSLSITPWTVAAAARNRSIGNRGAVSGDDADAQFI